MFALTQLKLIASNAIVSGPTDVPLLRVTGIGPKVPVLVVIIADSIVADPPTVTEPGAAMVVDFANPTPAMQNLLPAAVGMLRIDTPVQVGL